MLKYAHALIFISFFLVHSESNGQWVQTDGLYGGYVTALAGIGNHLFAGSNAGVFVSTDNGKSWTQTSTENIGHDVTSLAVMDSILYAGTSGYGVFYSSNFGNSWIKTGPLPQDFSNPESANCLLARDKKLYAGTYQGVYRSTDGGVYWSKLNPLLPMGYIRSIVLKDTLIFTAAENGVYRSSLNNSNWRMVLPGYPNLWINTLAVKDSFLFAGTRNGLFLSSDNGDHWIKPAAGIKDSDITALSFIGSDILAGTYNGGAYVSGDNGKSWKLLGLENEHIMAFLYNDSGLYAGTWPGGIMISNNKDSNWTAARLINSSIYAIASTGNKLIAGTSGGIFISGNNGLDWTESSNGLPENFDPLCIASDGNILAAAMTFKGVYVSTDNGANWNFSLPVPMRTNCIALKGKNIYAGTADGLFISTDGGNGWFQPKDGLPSDYAAQDLAVSGNNLTAVLTDSTGNNVYFSADNGVHWHCFGLSDYCPVAAAAAGTDIFIATQVHGVFLSRDYGRTWIQKKDGLPPMSSMKYHLEVKDSCIFFQTFECIYLSTDYGDSWGKVHTSLPKYTSIYSMTVFNNNLYIAPNGMGLWMCPLSAKLTSVKGRLEKFPSGFRLGQNYPNPFNPETTINYSIPENARVEVKVFDTLGREIQTLVNKEQEIGDYSIQFVGNNLPSGMYIYSLHAGGFSASKKLLLVR
ncbi:MAG TPA: T9SS type A sorting domain-containing protein [Ignavibacteriales bacterium]|nr:T9SS type A sorting domain-containing protein [Ignavibacteriales bacterium]